MPKFFIPWLLFLMLAKDSRSQSTTYRLVDSLTNVTGQVVTLSNAVADLSRQFCGSPGGRRGFLPMDCSDHLLLGSTASGVYSIHPSRCRPDLAINVYCDMLTDGGGWTVFLNREEQEVQENFTRTWEEYRQGFGDLLREHWLGNDVLHALTNTRHYHLRVDMADFNGTTGWANYDTFAVDSEADLYRLTVTGYTGNAGDAMKFHNTRYFSTYNNDNDANSEVHCSERMKGGFWFSSCAMTNPTGLYLGEEREAGYAVVWRLFAGRTRSLKTFSFKIRPRECSSFVHHSQ